MVCRFGLARARVDQLRREAEHERLVAGVRRAGHHRRRGLRALAGVVVLGSRGTARRGLVPAARPQNSSGQ